MGRPTVEEAAILAAQQYAAVNGYPPEDRRAVGLVLAGMAIASSTSRDAQAELIRVYLEQLPAAASAIAGWARLIDNGTAGMLVIVDG